MFGSHFWHYNHKFLLPYISVWAKEAQEAVTSEINMLPCSVCKLWQLCIHYSTVPWNWKIPLNEATMLLHLTTGQPSLFLVTEWKANHCIGTKPDQVFPYLLFKRYHILLPPLLCTFKATPIPSTVAIYLLTCQTIAALPKTEPRLICFTDFVLTDHLWISWLACLSIWVL